MAITLLTKNQCRIVPLRFARASTGEPDRRYPDIDDRGHHHVIPAVNGLATSAPIGGAAVAMAVNSEVDILMIREDIDHSAPLFARSSDDTLLGVLAPESGQKCSNGKTSRLTLKSNDISGSIPKLVFVDIRFGKANGPIIARLAIYVFPTLVVNVQVYYVTIDDSAGNSGTCPALSFNPLMQQAQAIWSHYGVELAFAKLKNIRVKLNKKDYLQLADINTLYQNHWTSKHINIYVVQQLEGQNCLGYSFTPQDYAGYVFSDSGSERGAAALPLSHPGVFIAMKTGAVEPSNNTQSCAHNVARQIGHFFNLHSPGSHTPHETAGGERSDTWSMRLLMNKQNISIRSQPPQNGENWPDFNEFGYGSNAGVPYQGCLVSLKNLLTPGTAGADGQCSIARNHISKGISALY